MPKNAPMAKSVKAWHFIADDYRLGFGDNRRVKAGSTVKVTGPLELCHHGLHGSRRVLDALRYARGPVVCRVIISGDIVEGNDKLVGRERYIEWTLDATYYLHEFACQCAERALKTAGETDERCWQAIAAKRDADDRELAVFRNAAVAAAWAAAVAAARAADAAVAAARDAAWAAAWAAAWDAQNRKLTRMLMEAE